MLPRPQLVWRDGYFSVAVDSVHPELYEAWMDSFLTVVGRGTRDPAHSCRTEDQRQNRRPALSKVVEETQESVAWDTRKLDWGCAGE